MLNLKGEDVSASLSKDREGRSSPRAKHSAKAKSLLQIYAEADVCNNNIYCSFTYVRSPSVVLIYALAASKRKYTKSFQGKHPKEKKNLLECT